MSEGADQLGPVVAPPPTGPLTSLERPPTFSIVIPTYQAADTVAESIESALAQEQPASEVIVVDDGSTDRLEEALRPFRARIELISKENGGGASALNVGAVAASGDFIAILDADDAYHPRRIAALSALGRARPDLDLITTDARFIVAGETVGSFAANTPFAVQNQRTKIFENCFPGGWPAVRRERLLAIGGFDENLRTGYDWDCWSRSPTTSTASTPRASPRAGSPASGTACGCSRKRRRTPICRRASGPASSVRSATIGPGP